MYKKCKISGLCVVFTTEHLWSSVKLSVQRCPFTVTCPRWSPEHAPAASSWKLTEHPSPPSLGFYFSTYMQLLHVIMSLPVLYAGVDYLPGCGNLKRFQSETTGFLLGSSFVQFHELLWSHILKIKPQLQTSLLQWWFLGWCAVSFPLQTLCALWYPKSSDLVSSNQTLFSQCFTVFSKCCAVNFKLFCSGIFWILLWPNNIATTRWWTS